MAGRTAIVWFRNDLRTRDNPALWHAMESGSHVVAAFCDVPGQWAKHDLGEPKVGFIRRSVAALAHDLARLNVWLVRLSAEDYRGSAEEVLRLAHDSGAESLWFNEEYELNERRRDARLEREAGRLGVRRFPDQTVMPLGENDRPYKVFTPFLRSVEARIEAEGFPAELPEPAPQPGPPVEEPEAVQAGTWAVGQAAAWERLEAFLADSAAGYSKRRDRADLDGTSALSPFLAVGTLSGRQCAAALRRAGDPSRSWFNELIWRDFYRHITLTQPDVCRGLAFKPEADRVGWRDDPDAFAAWCEGRTGVPIVDAAMRCLAETGWMHNRLRMVVAMYLSKNLLIDWRQGERWFNQRLVDADFASNNGGWQWSASTGADAAPYFRIFNPTLQSAKTDPEGVFIRRWVPELASLDSPTIHDPGPLERAAAGYPTPIVNHAMSRDRAIQAFKSAGGA